MTEHKENRRSSRAKHDSVLEIHDEAGKFIADIGRLVNVSIHGVCFSSIAPMAVGQKIQGRLRLLKEGILDIQGRVVWARKKANATLYGIEFESVSHTR